MSSRKERCSGAPVPDIWTSTLVTAPPARSFSCAEAAITSDSRRRSTFLSLPPSLRGYQPVQSVSDSLCGEPRHFGSTIQRSGESVLQHSGRNAAYSHTGSRHSQHRQHGSSSHAWPRHDTRYFYEGQLQPGSRGRGKRGAELSDGDVLGAPCEYTAS